MNFKSVLELRERLMLHYQQRTINAATSTINMKIDKLLSSDDLFIFNQKLVNSEGLISYDNLDFFNDKNLNLLYMEGRIKFNKLLFLFNTEKKRIVIQIIKDLIKLQGKTFDSIKLIYFKYGINSANIINILLRYLIIYPSKYYCHNHKNAAYNLHFYSPEIILFILNIKNVDTFKKHTLKKEIIEQFVISNYIKSTKFFDSNSIKLSLSYILDNKLIQ